MSHFGPYVLIIAASIIVLLSFLFGSMAKKTNIPSVLMLIVLGIITQFILKAVGTSGVNFFPSLEILGIVGLIMIVLEAALELKLKKEKIGMIVKSFVVAALGLIGSVVVAALILQFLIPKMGWTQALLYATPLSILSSAIIIPSVSQLEEKKKEFHIYESTFSDILGIMLFYFLIGLMDVSMPLEEGQVAHASPILAFFYSLGLTLIVAFIASYLLLIIFQHITTGARLFLLIAMLLLLYAAGKLLHLSPLIIILVFGLLVSNEHLFFKGFLKKLLNQERFVKLEDGLHIVTIETAFLVRTFFFVIFGASIALSSLLSLKVLIVSVLLLASIYGVRWVFLKLFVGSDLQPQLLDSS